MSKKKEPELIAAEYDPRLCYYLSSSFNNKDEMKRIAEELKKKDVNVISTWINGGPDYHRMVEGDVQHNNALGDEDISQIEDCDVFVAFTTNAGGKGGRHFELGYAIAVSKHRNTRGPATPAIILVGPRENVFHYHNYIDVHFETVEEFLDNIDETGDLKALI